MAIDPTGGERDASLAARRRMLETKRESELDRVEESYSSQVKEQEKARGEAIRRARQTQAEELARVQNDVAHKVTLASQTADQQLRHVQGESQRLTEEASRGFRQKAQVLAKAQQEMDSQRNQLLTEHADSLKKMAEDNEFVRTQMRLRHANESQLANNQGEMAVKTLNKKQELEMQQLREDMARQKREAQAMGADEYYRLKSQQNRLKEELTQEELLIAGRGQERLEGQRKNLADRYQSERIQAEGNIESLRLKNQQQMRELQETGHRKFLDVKDKNDRELGISQKDSQRKLAQTREMTTAGLQAMDRDFEARRHLQERDYHKKMSDLRGAQDQEQHTMEVKTSGMRQKANEQYLAQAKEIREKRDGVINGLHDTLQKDVNRIIAEGSRQSELAKHQTAQTVSGTLSKGQDPFYRIRQLGVSLVERDDGMMLVMQSPEHEKDNIRITNNATGITVSGNRRFEVRNEVEPGRIVTTNSYQSYTETIPLPYKVDAARIARSYDAGVLKIFLPKA